MEKKFHEVLSGIHRSWLTFTELEVFFTGGGADLNMVTRLAGNQPIGVGGRRITPVPVKGAPVWLGDECEDVIDFYPQLAVCIGGACHGAGKTHLGVDRELEELMRISPDAQWKMEGFRDGQ